MPGSTDSNLGFTGSNRALAPRHAAAVGANALLVILAAAGFWRAVPESGWLMVVYYTHLSNAVALVSALLLVVALLRGGVVPGWVRSLRYVATCMLVLTFLVSLLVLVPLGSSFVGMFFQGSGLFHHLLCPAVSLISYLVVEDKTTLRRPWMLMVAVTLFYGLTFLLLNTWNLYLGPYPFLEVHNQSWVETVVWFLVLVGSAWVVGVALAWSRRAGTR